MRLGSSAPRAVRHVAMPLPWARAWQGGPPWGPERSHITAGLDERKTVPQFKSFGEKDVLNLGCSRKTGVVHSILVVVLVDSTAKTVTELVWFNTRLLLRVRKTSDMHLPKQVHE